MAKKPGNVIGFKIMLLVDSHCHLDSLDYQTLHRNVDDVLAKAKARDVGFLLAVATTTKIRWNKCLWSALFPS